MYQHNQFGPGDCACFQFLDSSRGEDNGAVLGCSVSAIAIKPCDSLWFSGEFASQQCLHGRTPLGVLVSGLILLTLMNSTSHLVFGHKHLLCHLTNVLIQSEIVRRWRQIYR